MPKKITTITRKKVWKGHKNKKQYVLKEKMCSVPSNLWTMNFKSLFIKFRTQEVNKIIFTCCQTCENLWPLRNVFVPVLDFSIEPLKLIPYYFLYSNNSWKLWSTNCTHLFHAGAFSLFLLHHNLRNREVKLYNFIWLRHNSR